MRKFLGGVAAVCLVVNLAACSGKSDTSESATPAPETSVAASAPAAPSAPVESSAEPAAPITDKGPAAIATDGPAPSRDEVSAGMLAATSELLKNTQDIIATDGPAPSRDEVSAGMLAATSELLKNTQDIPEAQKAMLPQLVECTVDEALNRGLSEQGQRNIAAQVLLLSQEDQAIMGEAAKVCGEKFGAN